MPLVDMKDMLQHAYQHGYAVGAFEVISLDFLDGIMQAAEQARAPVILSMAESHFEYFDFDLMMPAVEVAAKRALVPVAIHFDHGAGVESAINGINQGCNGVLVDASHEDFMENTRITREVVEVAQACGVAVEGELGYVPGVEGEGAEHYPGEFIYTSLAEAKAYVERTGIDFLAVSIGTVHGQMKGKPKLDYQRLKQINDSLGMPLVIHGGTGLSDDQFHRLISNGVAKINCFTALSDVVAKQIRKNSKMQMACSYTGLTKDVNLAVADEVERCMRLWGSAGRAAEVLARCWSWVSVEQIIICTVEGIDSTDTSALMNEGRNLLRSIPGVRDVFFGEALQEDAKYHYSWRIRLCHPCVIDSYQKHSAYDVFTKKLLSSVSGRCINIDFQEISPNANQFQTEQIVRKRVVS